LPLTGGTLSGPVNVPTLNAPSGVLATQNGMTGIAKAWVNFNGTTGAINSSFNVSSITINNTGYFTVNFTTAMPNTNYVPYVDGTTSGSVAGKAQLYCDWVPTNTYVAPTTSSFVWSYSTYNGGSRIAPTNGMVAVFSS
jgi:hypothetical protein